MKILPSKFRWTTLYSDAHWRCVKIQKIHPWPHCRMDRSDPEVEGLYSRGSIRKEPPHLLEWERMDSFQLAVCQQLCILTMQSILLYILIAFIVIWHIDCTTNFYSSHEVPFNRLCIHDFVKKSEFLKKRFYSSHWWTNIFSSYNSLKKSYTYHYQNELN